jgi:hypothetical protein
MTPTKIAMGGAGIFALLFTFAIQRIPAPAEAINLRPSLEPTITVPYETKVEALRAAYAVDKPRVIAIERVILDPQPTMPTPTVVPPILPTQHVKVSLPSPPPRLVKDTCARHGMHKRMTRGGKSWRCQR